MAELSQRVKQVLAKRPVAQTEGRQIRKEVRANDASIIAAIRQIVTLEIRDRLLHSTNQMGTTASNLWNTVEHPPNGSGCFNR